MGYSPDHAFDAIAVIAGNWLRTALLGALAGFASLGWATESLVPDPTLGGGIREYNFVARDGTWRAIKTQADGKIVLAGRVDGFVICPNQTTCPRRTFALQRLNADGSLDRTFAPNSPTPGTVAVGVGVDPWETAGFATGLTLAIDGSGNYVVGGTQEVGDNQLAFARIKADGSRDTTLNPQGALPGTFLKNLGAGREGLYAMVIDAQGRYVIGGFITENHLRKAFVGRMLSTGALDTSFNPSGPQPGVISFFVPTSIPISGGLATAAAVYALKVDINGRIVFGGGTGYQPTDYAFGGADPGTDSLPGHPFVGRLTSNGTFDATFAAGGALTGIRVLENSQPIMFQDVGKMAIDSQGRILYAGAVNQFASGKAYFRIYRLDTNGVVDTSFGGQSASLPGALFLIPNAFAGPSTMLGLEVLADDQVLVVGTAWYTDGGESRMFVTRLSSAGLVLSPFGNVGPGGAPGYRVINHQGPGQGASPHVVSTVAGSAALTNGKLLLLSPVRGMPQRRAVYAVSADTGADDLTFGSAGQVALSGVDNEDESPVKLFQRTGGGYFLAGKASANGTGGYSFWLARADATGALDTGWQSGALRQGVLRWVGRDDFGLYNLSNMSELPDGRILIAGNAHDTSGKAGWTVLRLLADGSTDNTYGNGANYPGTFFYQNGTSADQPFATAFDSAGNTIIAGTTEVGVVSRAIVFRVTAEGKLDDTFGDGVNPYIVESFGNNAVASGPTKVLLGAGGKITIVGESNQHPAAARYLSNGTLDVSFSPGSTRPGATVFDNTGSIFSIPGQGDAILDQNGRLVIAGGDSLANATLIRVLSNGAIDPGFGAAGIASCAACLGFWRVAEASDGALYAITPGTVSKFSVSSPTVVRFTAAGAVDKGFGSLGAYLLTQNQGFDHNFASDMQLDPQGRLLVLASWNPHVNDNYLIRQNTLLYRFTRLIKRADIDGNNSYDASTDGLLALRYLFGLTGTALTNGAIGAGATVTTPTDIALQMESFKPTLDVDGNGKMDALTDGLIFIRYLFGLRGAPLIAGAIGTGATRTTPEQIETYLQSLLP